MAGSLKALFLNKRNGAFYLEEKID